MLLAGASLAALPLLQAAPTDPQLWMNDYRRNPQPDALMSEMIDLAQAHYFSSGRDTATAIGFLTAVFQQNPQRVDVWLEQCREFLPGHAYRVMLVAAWQAGNPGAARRVAELAAYNSPEVRADVLRMVAQGPAPLAASQVVSEDSMRAQYGAFLASGDRRYIVNILAAVGSDQPGVAAQARYELAQDAAADPQVMAICREQLAREPYPLRSQIEATLNQGQARPPGT